MTKTKQKKIPKLRFPGFNDEWEEKNLGDFADVSKLAGFEFTKHIAYSESGTLIGLRGLNIKNNKLDLSDVKYIDKSDLSKLNRSKLYIDDMMFTYVGTVGEVALIPENEKYYLAPNVSRIRVNKNVALPKFVEKYFNINIFKNKEIKSLIATSSQPALSMTNIRKFRLNIPKIYEQEKIAGFLGAVDEKIDLLIKKKEQLEKYKKGLMQKIFNQEIRFKDKNGQNYPDWQPKKLGDIFSGEKGSGLSWDDVTKDGKNKCILYVELYTKYLEKIDYVLSRTAITSGVISKKNDLLLPCSTTTTGIDLANATALDEEGVLLGGDISVLRFKESGSNLFYAYYLTHFMKYKLAAFGQGSTIVHMYYSHYKNMHIIEPALGEQKKVATFLSSIDKKINLQERKLEKAKEFKKALLQQMFI